MKHVRNVPLRSDAAFFIELYEKMEDPYAMAAFATSLKNCWRMHRRWRLLREAVRVRPYALFWLEQSAMRAEKRRIALSNSGHYDAEAREIADGLRK